MAQRLLPYAQPPADRRAGEDPMHLECKASPALGEVEQLRYVLGKAKETRTVWSKGNR